MFHSSLYPVVLNFIFPFFWFPRIFFNERVFPAEYSYRIMGSRDHFVEVQAAMREYREKLEAEALAKQVIPDPPTSGPSSSSAQ